MDLSVIVCTYNRASNLPRCLGALAAQENVTDIRWEVLVVDNNSTDETPAMVEKLKKELPITIRYTQESRQGLSHARNAGIRETQSPFIAFVDDDIAVGPTWLRSLYRCFRENDADAVGGRIHLDPSIQLPNWIRDEETKGFLGFQDYGDEPFRMDGRSRYPYGGNMAFHRRVVERIGYFDPKLGRKGEGRTRTELFKGEETEYIHTLAQSGNARIFYEPGAIVYHLVQPFQLEKRYFRTIHYNAGYQRAFYGEQEFPNTLFGIPRFYYALLAKGVLKYLAQVITRGPDHAFRQQMTVGHLVGTMLGYRDRCRLDKPPCT